MQKSATALAVVALLSLASVTHAQQFKSVVDALAIKSNAGYTNPSWGAAQHIKGIKWQWPYYESGAHEATMEGKTKVGKDKSPYVGDTTVTIRGSRTMITEVEIAVQNASVDIAALGPGKATKLKTSCDDDSASYSFALYRFDRRGYLPLYVSAMSSYGASGDAGIEVLRVFLARDNALQSEDTPCVITRQ